MNKLLKIICGFFLFCMIVFIGYLLIIVLAVKDMNTDFVEEHNITEVNCSNLTESIIDLDYICGKYFSYNKQTYCKRNITNYYISFCEVEK